MFALLLTLHLTTPQLHIPAPPTPHLQLASFRAPNLGEAMLLQLPPPVTPAIDPNKGSVRAFEVGVGAATSVGSSGLAGLVALAAGLAVASTDKNGGPGAIFIGFGVAVILYALFEVVILPPVIALMEYAVSDAPLAGSLGRAVAYAYAGQGIMLALVTVAALISGLNADLATGLAVVAFYGMELVGIPVLASLGLHGGDNARGPNDPAVPTPAALPPPDAMPPQLAPPPSGPGPLPTLPPTALNFTLRF